MRSRRPFAAASAAAGTAARAPFRLDAALRLGAWLAAAAPLAPAAARAEADLIHIEVEAERAVDGRPIAMEFHEIERTPEVSRARVLAGAGGSASAVSIFVLRGFCAVAESRGARYFYPRPPREPGASEAVHVAEFASERAAVTPARPPGPAAMATGAASAAPPATGYGTPDGVYSIDDCRLAGFVR